MLYVSLYANVTLVQMCLFVHTLKKYIYLISRLAKLKNNVYPINRKKKLFPAFINKLNYLYIFVNQHKRLLYKLFIDVYM